MMNRQIAIKDATDNELRQFGRDNMGLTLPPNCKRDTLIAKIKATWNKDYILIAEEEAKQSQDGDAPRPVTDAQQPPERKMVRIHIAVTEDRGGDEAVPVGVNGKVMLIPRGQDCDIPEEYYEVLKNAISYKYEPLPDGKGLNPEPRKVPMYSFQVIAA